LIHFYKRNLYEHYKLKWAGHDLDPVVARTAATVENQNVPVDHDPEIGREVDDTDVIGIDTAGADIPLAQIPATPQDVVEKRWTDWQTEKEEKL